MYTISRMGSKTRVKPDFLPSIILCAALLISSCGGGSSPDSNHMPEPSLSFSPTSLSFGSQTVGTASAAQSITLTNAGSALLSITSISASGDFAATDTCGGGLAAGRNCSLSVTFTPSASGTRTGSVTIIDNAAGSPHTISLTGTGQVANISIQLSPGTLFATQDGQPSSLAVSVARLEGFSNSVTLSVTGLPTGATSQITSPGTGNDGEIIFTAKDVPAGTYSVTVNASAGASTASAPLTFVAAIVSVVQNSINTSVGINGRLQQFMSTSFQPAEWDYNFFLLNPGATAPLSNLNPQHIRLEPVSGGTPQKGANAWDFSDLDAILDPVIGVGDKSPELQIAVAPDFMRNADGTFVDPTYNQFAQYCANLVKYYNTATGFTDGAGHVHVHSNPPTPITWWGIFDEPNINKLSASEYAKMYNVVVPAMQAAGSIVPLKFAAVELSDFDTEPQDYLPAFISGVNQQVDVLATHYYSSCNQADADSLLFAEIPKTFVPNIKFIYSALKTNSSLAAVPVWVTENNVNADYDANGNGISACNGTPFVLDRRGSSPFFAAWRPYVFSQLGQAGNQALYQWVFALDQQYGEVDFDTGKPYLSYWVDYYLQRYFPSPPGSDILVVGTTDTNSVEVLATRNDDGSVVVMVANRALHLPTDNNGPGDPRTVVVDISDLGAFTTASLLTIDANTDILVGPAAAPLNPAPRMTISLGGYGVAFLYLK